METLVTPSSTIEPAPGWALITGASGRLGRALSHLAAEAGYGLVLSAPLSSTLAPLVRELEPRCGPHLLVLPVDLATPNGAELLAQDLRERALPIRLVIHGAALHPAGPFLDLDSTHLQDQLQLGLLTVAQLCRGLGPGLQDRGGQVLLLSPGLLDGNSPVLNRPIAAWQAAFARELERELSPGLRVRCFAPGPASPGQDPDTLARSAWRELAGDRRDPDSPPGLLARLRALMSGSRRGGSRL